MSNILGELSSDEIEAVEALRREKARIIAISDFKRKAIETAHRFDVWSEEHGYSLTFSTFVNTFGYEGNDSKSIYEALERIQKAALPVQL